jgi:H+/Cl- antiporter ClcA
VINEAKMAVVAFLVGVLCGLVIGSVGKTYNWPTSAMQSDGQAYSLVISVMVSAAAGAVLAGTVRYG